MNANGLHVVTWNCAGALRKKWQALEPLKADLLIIQECENPAIANDHQYLEWAGQYLWTGASKNKGIGVFARKDFRLEHLPIDVTGLQYFLPCRVNGVWPLLATWTGKADSGTYRYIGQLWQFLQIHKDSISHPFGMVIGDLNSNCQWDRKHRVCNHRDVVRELSNIGFESSYHRFFSETHGMESRPTFYLQRNLAKSYHIDYAFVGPGWIERCVEVGQINTWLTLSDHMPLSIRLFTAEA